MSARAVGRLVHRLGIVVDERGSARHSQHPGGTADQGVDLRAAGADELAVWPKLGIDTRLYQLVQLDRPFTL
jgi:hypothetical protein